MTMVNSQGTREGMFSDNPGDVLRTGEILKMQRNLYIELVVEPSVPYMELCYNMNSNPETMRNQFCVKSEGLI